MVKFMPMRNRSNCTANRIFLPDGSNFLQRSLRHNVTFFWICVICILMHRTSALFQIYSGKHSGFCTNQLSKIWEHERQSFFQKLSSQKRCNSRARHVLYAKKTAISTNLSTVTCHCFSEAVTAALPVSRIRHISSAKQPVIPRSCCTMTCHRLLQWLFLVLSYPKS